MSDNNIRGELTSANRPQRNEGVEPKFALFTEGGTAAFSKLHTMFEGVQFPAKAQTYDRM